MTSITEDNMAMIRLDDGDDFFLSLKDVAKKHGFVYGCVLFGIGQIRNFELGYFDGSKYIRKYFPESYELVSLHGTFSMTSDPPFHLHATVSKNDFITYGGHLFRATVATVGEVYIQKFSKILIERELDSRDGLKKMTLK